MAFDFNGLEISVGDEVIFCELGYRNLTKGKIKKITPKTVIIDWHNKEVKQFHSQVIVNKP